MPKTISLFIKRSLRHILQLGLLGNSSYGRSLWIVALLISLVSLFGLFASAYFFRIPLAQWVIVTYAQKHNIIVKLQIKKLDVTEVLLENISIDGGIRISKVHLLRDPASEQIAGIRSLVVDVESIDIETTQKLIAEFSPSLDNSAPSSSLLFSDLYEHCKKTFPTEINLSVKNLVHENTTVPLNIRLEHQAGSQHMNFSFSGSELDFQKNDKFILKTQNYSGHLSAVCEPNAITVKGNPLLLKIARLSLHNPPLKMEPSEMVSKNFSLVISKDNTATFQLPLNLKISAQSGTQLLKGDLPSLSVNGTYSLDASQKNRLELTAKNLKLSAPHNVSAQSLLLDLSSQGDWSTHMAGALKVANVSYTLPPKPKKVASAKQDGKSLKPLFTHVSATVRFEKQGEAVEANIDVSDKTKNLAITQLNVKHSTSGSAVSFKKHQTQIKLNSQITELLPITQEHIKSLSGTLSAEGTVTLKDDALNGKIKLSGKDISLSSGYGDIMGLQWEHDVLSLKTFASSSHQSLFIKSFTAGKTIDNISLDYQVLGPDNIQAQKLHLEHEKALIEAENFSVHPLRQELKNFKASIKNLPLEKVLALAVGAFVTATGDLSGHLNLEFKDKIPTVNGRLTSNKDGWILYRKDGDTQQKGLQLSDSPMTILNSYLYNFNYKTLDLDIRSNKNYEMNVLLGAYGHNPDYLNGKPLKLKLNLEQNVLAAIQSMMLSYDLPSKLKERIEKNAED